MKISRRGRVSLTQSQMITNSKKRRLRNVAFEAQAGLEALRNTLAGCSASARRNFPGFYVVASEKGAQMMDALGLA